METLVECRNVTKQREQFVLDSISFELKPGYIMGVIGRNGTGKTTLLQTMMGSLRLDCVEGKVGSLPKEGMDVQINGVSILKDVRAYKEQFAYVLNETPFAQGMGALANGKLFGKYYRSFDLDKYRGLLEEFGVPPKNALMKLSAGQQIRQQLAFALSYDAKVYFFDEPTSNLDVEFRDAFYKHIREIVSDGTKSVIYASHLVEEMEEFADYILWLESVEESGSRKCGRERYFGTIDDLKNSYRIVDPADLNKGRELVPKEWIVGGRRTDSYEELLVHFPEHLYDNEKQLQEQICKAGRYGDLKEIMYYVEKSS